MGAGSCHGAEAGDGVHGERDAGLQPPPSPSTTNIDLTQGVVSRDDLLQQMGTGLLVTSMIGSTINRRRADYSRGASGFWVGKRADRLSGT